MQEDVENQPLLWGWTIQCGREMSRMKHSNSVLVSCSASILAHFLNRWLLVTCHLHDFLLLKDELLLVNFDSKIQV